MGFREAIRTCLGKYLTVSGRAGRAEFWWFFLFYNLATLAGFVVVMATVSEGGEGGVVWPLFVAILFLLPPMIAVTGRRLHDKGLTAWVVLIMIVPFGSLALLIICALPGEAENNAYGPAIWSPPAEPTYTKSNIPNVKDRDRDRG